MVYDAYVVHGVPVTMRIVARAPKKGERGWAMPVGTPLEEWFVDVMASIDNGMPGWVAWRDEPDGIDSNGLVTWTIELEFPCRPRKG